MEIGNPYPKRPDEVLKSQGRAAHPADERPPASHKDGAVRGFGLVDGAVVSGFGYRRVQEGAVELGLGFGPGRGVGDKGQDLLQQRAKYGDKSGKGHGKNPV